MVVHRNSVRFAPSVFGCMHAYLTPSLCLRSLFTHEHDALSSCRLKDSPEFATSIGVHNYDDRLDDRSVEAYNDRTSQLKKFAARGEELLAADPSPAERLNLELFVDDMRLTIAGAEFETFLQPLSALDGPSLDLPRVIEWVISSSSSGPLMCTRNPTSFYLTIQLHVINTHHRYYLVKPYASSSPPARLRLRAPRWHSQGCGRSRGN